ncbi:MAG: transglycosylase domain-containing protein [Paludibacter sp.]|jgi:penicillin-binding protein 1A|nr:transglycosylase domain-containing protein [Paludibacter sp.]
MTNTSVFRRKFLKWFWSLFAAAILFVILFFVLINFGLIGYMPPLENLQNPIDRYATELYTSDNQLLGRISYSEDNRMKTEFPDISPNVIKALIATEDKRYYSHSGVDGKGLLRAIILLGKGGGGSTISQQLAKLLYSKERAHNIIERAFQKPNEWVIAVKLEKIYSKEEIITLYLNMYDWLYNAVGIKSAAKTYFDLSPDQLNIEQAAMLVGMLKNSSYYNPRRRETLTFDRRNVVLNQMMKANYISNQQYDSLKVLPMTLNFKSSDHKEGDAPYFREYIRMMMTAKEPKKSNYAEWQAQKFLDDKWQWENNPLYGFCVKNKKANGENYNLYTDGLKIYTTIDSRMQKYAQEAVHEHMTALQQQFFKEKKSRKNAPYSNKLKQEDVDRLLDRSIRQSERYIMLKKSGLSHNDIMKNFNNAVEMEIFDYSGVRDTVMTPLDSIRYYKHFLRCGFMSIDPHSGHVKAYIGGTNFTHFQYDMATLGRRQVGSTVKPYLYTLAMEEGMEPCDTTRLQPITLMAGNGQPWTPRNASKARLGEMVTLRWGLANSNNWVSAYLMGRYTPEALAKLMRSFGIKGQIVADVSLCLGPCEVTVAEMVDAYTAFPNKGIRVDPVYVTRIEDSNGNVIASFNGKTYEIFSETTSYKMIYMMRSVVDAGTGGRVRSRYGLTMPMGGKTGTTNDNADGWFMGYTPSLVSGVWVGGEERDIHFDSMAEGQGASMALPIWALYMKKVLGNTDLGYLSTEPFDVPSSFNPNAACE